jgi:amino acid transporter
MTNMIGVGPFITIPLLMSALGGPQAMLGWLVALVIVICDGMVWSELGAAMPGSGGSFHYLREAFARTRLGRLMPFLFVWQFVLSGPLEIASGYIGFASYASYIWKGLTRPWAIALIVMVGLLNVALLYRRIHSIAKITVSLWIGTLVTVLAVILTGATHFDPRIAFDFPPGAFYFSLGFFLGLGAATRVGIYDYLGYYDVCYIGDEVRDPGRVIPRSILISTAAVALIYVGINLSIIGVIPWREFVPASAHPESNFIVSILMERVYGEGVATIFTLLILWTAFGSVFALLLGYSRIPFAAAQSGYFFQAFGRLHPTKDFPYVSLLVLGAISIFAGFFSLGTVIDALIVTRIVVQFMGQIVALMLLRRHAPNMERPFRMWLYPLPALVALLGWIFVFATTQFQVILFGVGVLTVGFLAFLLWSRSTERGARSASLIALLLLSAVPVSGGAQPPPPIEPGARVRLSHVDRCCTSPQVGALLSISADSVVGRADRTTRITARASRSSSR